MIPRTLREAAALEPGIDVEIRLIGGKVEIVASAAVERPRRTVKRARISRRTLKSV